MLLSVENVSYTYQLSEKVALRSVFLDVDKNEYVAVLGANGSGKSTLARCIVGLLPVESGSIRFDASAPGIAGDFAPCVPSALVFQSPADQIVAETVELDIAFGPENLGLDREEIGGRIFSALHNFGLESLADASTFLLTSGQKQHLSLAGVTVLHPAVLVLDEPTSMLSPLARLSVLSFLDLFHEEGGTILHITHDLSEASRAKRVIVLDDGLLVFDGTSDELSALPFKTLSKWNLTEEPPEIHHHKNDSETEAAEPEAGEPVFGCKNLGFGPLHDFNLQIYPGTITAITGESGSGKSVLLELLAGLRVPDKGSVFCAEGQTVSLAVQESEAGLFAEFVADDVAFGPRNTGLSGKALVSRVTGAMNVAGLPFADFAERRTFSLSGGERRKAALAGIIAMNTSIILLDEPSSALDTRSRSGLLKFILGLRAEGRTVVFTTNRTEECGIADSVIALPLPQTECYRCALNYDKSIDTKKYTRDQLNLEKLRRGASSSYVKLDTPIHRLAPVGKYILAVSAIAAAFSIRSWLWLSVLIVLECIPVALSAYSFKKLGFRFLKILPWLVLIVLLQYFISPGNILTAGFILRFIAFLIPLSLFIFVTPHTEIMYGMEDILFPLKILRIPLRDVSLVTGVVFRFITLLYEEAVRISTARIIRGAGRKRKNGLFTAISSMASLFVPLVLRTLTRSDRLSQAITARYYGIGKNSRYLHWHLKFSQFILIVAVPVFSGLLIFLSFFFGD